MSPTWDLAHNPGMCPGNQTVDLLVCGMTPNLLSDINQGKNMGFQTYLNRYQYKWNAEGYVEPVQIDVLKKTKAQKMRMEM